MKITVLDRISAPARPDGINEDACGAKSTRAWVIDGATGLGDRVYVPGAQSDAAWLAGFASARFAAANTTDIRDIVRRTSQDAATTFNAAASSADEVPAYALPSAAMILMVACRTKLHIAGLGDCRAWLRDDTGAVRTIGGLPKAEQRERDASRRARALADEQGHEGDLRHHPAVLDGLRRARADSNMSSSLVLGLDSSVAERMAVETLEISETCTILLTSDGFHALTTDYDSFSPIEMLEAAERDGLASLLEQVRTIEREVDPECRQFPRFKQSDDASALLIRIDP